MAIEVRENPFKDIANELANISSNGVKYFRSLPEEIQKNILVLLERYDNERFQELADRLYSDYFLYTPPTIEEFLNDPYFFGKLTSGMFPKWKENLIEKVFNPNRNVHEIILTGATGGGKSYFMRVVHAYLTTRILCMKNPNRLFGIADGDNIVIGFFNVTVKKARSDQFNQFEQLLLRSPFIRERVFRYRQRSDVLRINPDRPFENSTLMYALGSSAVHALGQNTISGQLDEANFASRKRLNLGEIERSMETYLAIKSRISSRFEAKMRIFYHYFIMMIASSKTFNNAFVEAHIDRVKNNENVLIFDYAEWDVKPPETYERDEHGRVKTFRILVGDKRVRSRILNDDEVVGPEFRVIHAPLTLKQYAEYDLDEFIRARAGISTVQELKFISRDDLVHEMFNRSEIKNLFYRDSVDCSLARVGELWEDIDVDGVTVRLYQRRYPKRDPSAPRYVHVDLSKNHDYTGFCIGHFGGYIPSVTNERAMNPLIVIDGVARFEYGRSEIDYEKIRNLIFYLNDELSYNIKGGLITFDQFQSTDSIQLLSKQGYNVKRVAIIPDMYQAMKSAILGKYLECPRNEILKKEILNLERDSKGVIQKPMFNTDGTVGTDDVSDALAAVCYHVISNHSVYAYDSESMVKRIERMGELVSSYNVLAAKTALFNQKSYSDYEPV